MHTLTPNEQCTLLHSVDAVLLRIVRGGTVPDIRPMTKLRTTPAPKKGKGVTPIDSFLFSSSTTLLLS